MPVGFLFITIQFTWWEILLIFVGGFWVIAINIAAVVLPVVALIALLRGRRKLALMLGAIAIPLVGWCFWPVARDAWQFRQAVAMAERAQVTRVVPDLTGKTVAFMVEEGASPDWIAGCTDLLRHSGAARVYLLAQGERNADDAGGTDLSGAMNLTRRILGQAVLRRRDWASSDEPEVCALGPTESGLRQIDYFIARNVSLYGDDAPQGMVPDRLVLDYQARLAEFFAPVADPRNFRITSDAADLVRIPVTAWDEGFPRPFGTIWRYWPQDPAEISAYHAPVRAALCRHATANCDGE